MECFRDAANDEVRANDYAKQPHEGLNYLPSPHCVLEEELKVQLSPGR